MDTGDVGWLLAQLRTERHLSQADFARLLADVSGNPAITRNEISRWESGRRTPRRHWLDHIAAVFGMTTRDFQDLARLTAPDADAEALELAARVTASDVSTATLDRLESAVDELAIAYPGTPPETLLMRVRQQLGYVSRLLDGRTTLAEQRRLIVVGGWLSLLDATCSIDLQEPAAARNLRVAAQLADHGEHAELAGWCLETRAWQALTLGDPRRALKLSQQAQAAAPEGSSAFIQATAQEGRVWARLRQSRETLDALGRVEALVAPLEIPHRPEHHYRYDPSKSNAYVATTLSWLGDPAAESYARQVLAHLESINGGPPRPRRAASARLDLSLALLASGKSDEASIIALEAVNSGRLVPSNYWRAAEVIDAVDGQGVPEADELRDAYEELPDHEEG